MPRYNIKRFVLCPSKFLCEWCKRGAGARIKIWRKTYFSPKSSRFHTFQTFSVGNKLDPQALLRRFRSVAIKCSEIYLYRVQFSTYIYGKKIQSKKQLKYNLLSRTLIHRPFDPLFVSTNVDKVVRLARRFKSWLFTFTW